MEFQKLCEQIINQLNEALGVPNNIVDQAERIYEQFLNFSKEFEGSSKLYEKKINDFKVEIGSLNYKNLILKVYFEHSENFKPTLKKFVSPLYTQLNVSKLRLKNLTNHNDLTIEMYVIVSSHEDHLKIYELLLNKKEQAISSIAHELHHWFSFSRQKELSAKTMINYKIVTQIDIPIPTISQFFDNLYFVSTFESLVRSSEIYALLKLQKIKKSQFVRFLDQDDTYKRLKQIENLEPSKFLNSLDENVAEIEKFLKDRGIKDVLTKEQMIDKALTIILEQLLKNHNHFFEQYLNNALQNIIINFGEQNQIQGDYSKLENYAKQVVKDSRKYEGNQIDYFLERISEMKEKASEIKKKLAKLYDLCLDEGIREEI